MFVRFAAEDNRFIFQNFFIKRGKKETLEGTYQQGSKTEATLQNEDDRLVISVKRGDALVNGQALSSPHPLAPGDRVTFTVSKKGETENYTWVYQNDTKAAHTARIEVEKAANIQRAAPDFEGKQRYQRWLRQKFKIDEKGLNVGAMGGRKRYTWDELDGVWFEISRHRGVSPQAAKEALVAMSQPGTVIGFEHYDPIFNEHSKELFNVWFLNCQRLMRQSYIPSVQARNCALIAQAVDYYAPVDLVNFFRYRR